MNTNRMTHEFVELVKVDRAGREHRESMPRWLAEMTIGCIPLEEPDIALAWIAPIQVDPQSPYPAKTVTPEQVWNIAFFMAHFLPAPLAA